MKRFYYEPNVYFCQAYCGVVSRQLSNLCTIIFFDFLSFGSDLRFMWTFPVWKTFFSIILTAHECTLRTVWCILKLQKKKVTVSTWLWWNVSSINPVFTFVRHVKCNSCTNILLLFRLERALLWILPVWCANTTLNAHVRHKSCDRHESSRRSMWVKCSQGWTVRLNHVLFFAVWGYFGTHLYFPLIFLFNLKIFFDPCKSKENLFTLTCAHHCLHAAGNNNLMHKVAKIWGKCVKTNLLFLEWDSHCMYDNSA